MILLINKIPTYFKLVVVVPQGSVLGTLLFLILINDLLCL